MWIAPVCRAHWCSGSLKEEPNDEIGVGERGKGAKCGGDRPRRNAEKQGGAVSHPGFWVPGTVPTVTPNPLLSCLPISFRCFCQTQASVSPGQRIPSGPLVLSQRAGGGQRAWASHTLLPRAPPPRPPSRKCTPPPPHSQAQPPPPPFISSGHMGARRPRTSPQCSNLRKETRNQG